MRIRRVQGAQAALVLPMFAAQVAMATNYPTLLARSTLNSGERDLMMAVAAGLALFTVVASVLGGISARRWPRGTSGRVRLQVSAVAAVLNIAGTGTATVMLSMTGAAPILRHGFGLGMDPTQLAVIVSALVVATTSMLVWIASAVSVWWLLQRDTQRKLWRVADIVILAAAVAAIALLPAQPPTTQPNALQLPVLRHAVTIVAVLRLVVRALPWSLDLVEVLSYHALIAARHLRAKKSGFLAVISLLAVMAVTVSSCALTTTLSVMGGFRNDLKRKILGNNAHIVIDRDGRLIDQWQPTLNTTAATAGVTGAAPFVSGEVMLSSSSNLATAVLRGIDPDRIGAVSDLPNNIRSGKLEYLTAPEKLLNLPPDVMGKMLLPVNDSLFAGPQGGDGLSNQPTSKNAGVSAADPAAAATPKPATVDDALAEFLIDEKPPSHAPKAGPARATLPGIIIGKELARSLRLYLGDEVNVVAPLGALGPSGPMPKARPFRVAGIFYSGMYEYDMKYTYVTLPTAQRFLNTGESIHGIEVKIADAERAPTVAAALRSKLSNDDVRVRDWQELNSRLFGALALEKLAMFIALGIAILVASFCIAATLMLMVQEKGRQIAVLKALGSRDRAIVAVFVVEGLMIGAFGSTLGLFLGYMVCFGVQHFGVRMNPEVYYIDKLPVHIEASEFLLVGVASIVVCLLVTIYPAVLGSRLRPVDALRYE